MAALSRFKHDAAQYRRHLIAAVAVTAFFGMGLGLDLSLTGRDIIRVVLGAKWGESGRIFEYFGPGIGIMLVYYTQGWIHLSVGCADRWLRWSLFESLFTCLLFVLALPWGPRGIACAWTASFWFCCCRVFIMLANQRGSTSDPLWLRCGSMWLRRW